MSPAEGALFGSGVALLLLALLWRVAARRRARRLVRRALRSPDAGERRAAVRVAGEQGLARHARALLERTRVETDPSVLAAIADEVARNHWEADDDASLVKLRLWARTRLEAGASQTPSLRQVQWPAGTGTGAAGTGTGAAPFAPRRRPLWVSVAALAPFASVAGAVLAQAAFEEGGGRPFPALAGAFGAVALLFVVGVAARRWAVRRSRRAARDEPSALALLVDDPPRDDPGGRRTARRAADAAAPPGRSVTEPSSRGRRSRGA